MYEWRGDLNAIAAAPSAFLDWLLRGGQKRSPTPSASRQSAPSGRLDARAERAILTYAGKLGFGLADGRKCAAYRFAAFLLHDLTLSASDAGSVVQHWNARNSPPLPDGQLAEIQRNAAKYGGSKAA